MALVLICGHKPLRVTAVPSRSWCHFPQLIKFQAQCAHGDGKTPRLRDGVDASRRTFELSFYDGVSAEWAEAVPDWVESTTSMFL